MSSVSDANAPLFEPITLAGCEIANRIVMAPMTRFFSTQGGVLAESGVDYYRRRAEGGAGLIITEGIATSDLAAQAASVPKLCDGPAFDMWVKVVNAVHGAGGKRMTQLWHTGLGRNRDAAVDPAQPSIGPMDDYLPEGSPLIATGGNNIPGRALKIDDIEATIAEFVDAAVATQRAGFDGLQLHAAHGYLIDQFFWSETNRRTDKYGGDIKGRTRFAAEIIGAIRQRVGPAYPLGLRFSQWKLPYHYQVKANGTPDELEAFLAPLVDAGIDYLDASTRRYWEPEFAGSALTLAGWSKKLTGLPVIGVGSIGLAGAFEPHNHVGSTRPEADLSRVVAMVERGEIDMVGVGRAMIANPAWANMIRAGDTGSLKPYDVAALGEHW